MNGVEAGEWRDEKTKFGKKFKKDQKDGESFREREEKMDELEGEGEGTNAADWRKGAESHINH